MGTERFRIWRTGSTVNAVASVEMVQRAAWQVRLQMDAGLRPMIYRILEGSAAMVTGERLPDRVRVHVSTTDGERWKEYPEQDADAILETGVGNHYLLLVWALRRNPDRPLNVLLPLEGRSVATRLAKISEVPLTVGGDSVDAMLSDVEIEGALHRVWLDENDRLLRVVDPRTGLEAVRAPADSLRIARRGETDPGGSEARRGLWIARQMLPTHGRWNLASPSFRLALRRSSSRPRHSLTPSAGAPPG